MNEGLEYAQMLEIPVSTVNVVKRRSLFARKQKPAEDLKHKVMESVNERVNGTGNGGSAGVDASGEITADTGVTTSAELGEGVENGIATAGYGVYGNTENNGYVRAEDITAPVKPKKTASSGSKILIAEAVAACLIASGIFLTNVFLPNTVINAFMGSLTQVKEKEVGYNQIKLTSVLSELSDAEIAVTDEGVIYFTEKATVYPVCDGAVASVTLDDGLYTVKIAHTSTFSSVITGLDTVYASVGEKVKSNLPFAYSKGENEVRVSMYDGNTLLNCYTLSGAVPVWNS